MAELGVIAGAAMLLAWLAEPDAASPPCFAWPGHRASRSAVGYRFLAPVDSFLRGHARAVTACTALLALLCAAALPRLSFDFNPMHLRNPNTEAVSTLARPGA